MKASFNSILLIIILFYAQKTESQNRYAIVAGGNVFFDQYADGPFPSTFEDHGNRSGWYVGALDHYVLNEKSYLQLGFVYSNYDEFWAIQVPLLYSKRFFGQIPFNWILGLQADSYSSKKYSMLNDKWLFYAVGGLSVDIGENFFIQGRYLWEISNHFNQTQVSIGLGYKL